MVSYAGELATCMYAGGKQNEDGSISGWREADSCKDVVNDNLLAVKQDTQLLGRHIVKTMGQGLGRIAANRQLTPEDVDWYLPLDFWETGFRAELSTDSCVGCGQCADKCPVQALSFPEPAHKQKKKDRPFIDPDRCIGCGQCVAAYRPGALSLVPRPRQAEMS